MGHTAARLTKMSRPETLINEELVMFAQELFLRVPQVMLVVLESTLNRENLW
jgi:hypothetical protein